MAEPRPRLHRGDVGPNVVELHRLLTIAGYPIETVHLDRFDGITHDAVTAFQRKRGLEATGIVGGETWRSLHEAGTPLRRTSDVSSNANDARRRRGRTAVAARKPRIR